MTARDFFLTVLLSMVIFALLFVTSFQTFSIEFSHLGIVNSFRQQGDPYSSIFQSPTELRRSDTDERMVVLLKESYNATHTEIRPRYNYCLQVVGEIWSLLDSIKRFHLIRLEIEECSARAFRIAIEPELE